MRVFLFCVNLFLILNQKSLCLKLQSHLNWIIIYYKLVKIYETGFIYDLVKVDDLIKFNYSVKVDDLARVNY